MKIGLTGVLVDKEHGDSNPSFCQQKTGEPLRDKIVIDRIVSSFKKGGSDAWFEIPASNYLEPEYDANDFEQIQDIADVWFDSGSTHAFVLEDRDDLKVQQTSILRVLISTVDGFIHHY